MQIDIEIDQVVIEQQIIKRPAHTSRSEWLDFWGSLGEAQEVLDTELEICEDCDCPRWTG